MSKRPLDEGLNTIKGIITDMADLAVKTVEASVGAYVEGGALEVQVRAWSDALRSMHSDIEEVAVELLARYQPVAIDLRTIKSSMKIAYDLSRFGRYAYDILHVLQLLNGYKRTELKDEFIEGMSKKVLEMLRLSVDIYKRKNFDRVEDLSQMENEVDDMYRRHLKAMAENPPERAAKCISDVLLTRHLERIADHACYIVEEVYYMVHGRSMYFR